MNKTKIDACKDDVKKQEADKKRLNEEIAKLEKEKQEMILEKEEQIKTYRARVEVITSNFAELLKSTLTKMQERIDDAQ